ncbi:hypothetical protein NUW58_g1615 [Xylaria curta]|uniref:Uncharacterized protein n=1 Tax=Xylaria curta TaxID=42375 RepID=A0ACC1PL73_9PEZI|nr:hypothetical protein NUW58_g1615 [Xylaria curta]
MPFQHNIPTRYTKKEKLEELLGELFPDVPPIEVIIGGGDQYIFEAPREVTEVGQGRTRSVFEDPFWAHRLIFSTYIPAWRHYMAWMEESLIKITNLTLIADIDREMRVNYEKLNTLYVLLNKLLQIPTLVSHSSDVLYGLSSHFMGDVRLNATAIQQIKNFQRQTALYSRTATCLHQRAQTTAQLLSDTLSLREQTVAKSQAENMANLSKSTYWITIMGLLYLPTTLIATIFGTNFFNFNEERNTVVVSADIWYLLVASGVLTVITLLVCYCFREYRTMVPQQSLQVVWWSDIIKRLRSIRKRDERGLVVNPV